MGKVEMKLIFGELIIAFFALQSNPDGSGGNAPDILQYVMLNADVTHQYTGFDPHAVHGIVTQDDGYIASGFSLYSEGNPKYEGFVTRVDLCDDLSKYSSSTGVFLDQPGNNCADSFTWSFKTNTRTLNDKLVMMAESPDGKYILAVGVKESNHYAFHRYIIKLSAATGELIWAILMPLDDPDIGMKSGYESIAFTQDGGFIMSGFAHYTSDEFPYFKSSGQVDDGKPLLEKFSVDVANAV